MEILSAAVGGGNSGDIALIIEGFKPVFVNYVIPIVLALGVIKIIQVVSRNMKSYFDRIKEEESSEVTGTTKPKQQA